jgi:hypothetical protein
MGYQLGTRVVLTPDQVSSIQNAFKRYQKALEITSSAIRFETPTGGLELDARFIRKDEQAFYADAQSFDYQVTGRIINANNTVLAENEYVVVINGRQVKSLGRFTWLSPNATLRGTALQEAQGLQSDGSYIVFDKEGNSIALITTTGEVVALGTPTIFTKSLANGEAIGYRCTCADYLGQTTDLRPLMIGEQNSNFNSLGARGACKHIYAVRIAKGDLINIPSAPPPNEGEARERKARLDGVKEFRNGASKSKIKWV